MKASRFIPARDTRHRTAVLALYRALLRSATRVPLPDAFKPTQPMRNPIFWLLRRRFANNKTLDSSRLIYAAMSAGYRLTNVLAEAKTKGSSQHVRISQHLEHSRIPERWLNGHMPKRREPPVRKTRYGIIRKITNPDGTIQYVPSGAITPKHFQNLKGRAPSVSLTNEGIPFIRLRKPQPDFLGKQIGKKRETIMKRQQMSVDAQEGDMNMAINEDTWEKIIAQQARDEGKTSEWEDDTDRDITTSYRWTPATQYTWWRWRNERQSYENFERAKGLQKISDMLYAEKNRLLNRPVKVPTVDTPEEVPANVIKGRAALSPFLDQALNIAGELPTPHTADPFAHPSWAAVVSANTWTMERDIYKQASLPEIPDFEKTRPKKGPTKW